MRIRLIGLTRFYPDPDVEWETDGWDGDALVEFAGRACYQSWHKPNPATATNEGYLRHILEVKHMSVLEHASATFYVTGVSRSLTHELVRHRHLSFSQLSQRFVDESDAEFVYPPGLEFVEREYLDGALVGFRNVYRGLVDSLTARGLPRKSARQAARCVLPNATETKIVVTGNLRAWRHFVNLRATAAADVEIRALAVAVLRKLQSAVPHSFADYAIERLDDTEIASTPNQEV